MHISAHGFWLPKAGNTLEEYEDDYDFSYNRRRQGKWKLEPRFTSVVREMKQPRFAVADGATESSFSGLWARLLVDSYVDKAPRTLKTFRKWVEICSRKWSSEVAAKSLPWYAEDKARQGAYATFIGLSVTESRTRAPTGGRWAALAVGDSCLFQIHGDELTTCFPVERADQFGYHPVLLSSIPEKNMVIWEKPDCFKRTGNWQSGDTFLLMTDALAHWFLKEVERGTQPWLTLGKVAEQDQILTGKFGEWISEMRTSNAMRNDDVTLLVITMVRDYETPLYQ